MKFKLLFLLATSIATILPLADMQSATAQCRYGCGVIGYNGAVHGSGTLPSEVAQKVNDLLARGNFREAARILEQLAQHTSENRNLTEAASHQALGDIYARMNSPVLASIHLKRSLALYQDLKNSQGYNEVQKQLQEVKIQQQFRHR